MILRWSVLGLCSTRYDTIWYDAMDGQVRLGYVDGKANAHTVVELAFSFPFISFFPSLFSFFLLSSLLSYFSYYGWPLCLSVWRFSLCFPFSISALSSLYHAAPSLVA